MLIQESKFTIILIVVSAITYLLTNNTNILKFDLIVGIVYILLGLLFWTNFFENEFGKETIQETIPEAEYFHNRRQFQRKPQIDPKSISYEDQEL